MFISKAVKQLKPYTVSSHVAWEIKDKSAVLKLDWYPDVNNTRLRKKIAEYSCCNSDEVEYFASSDALHEYVIRVFCEPGNSILMLSPTYDNFRAVSESAGISVYHHQIDFFDSNNITYESICKSLERIKPNIVYICNPNNPTGTVYDIKLLENLIKNNQDVMFLIDEAYYEFTKLTVSKIVPLFDNIIICRTFSKAFGLASFRVGYTISSKKNIAALNKVKNHKNISALAQVAAIAALDDIEYMESYVDDVLAAKDEFVNFLRSRSSLSFIEPQGGNFVLIDFGDLKSEIINHFKNSNIFIRDFTHINNMEGFARITIGNLEQMKKVMNLLSPFYSAR
jgi:histidinol-phosphate aminotransferase